MTLELKPSTIERLPLELSVAQETSLRAKELPSDVVEAAVAPHADAFAVQLESQLRTSVEVQRQDTVWASKGPLRFRPIAAMDFNDQCLYRALVNDIREEAAEEGSAFEQHAEFEKAVLAEESVRYVAIADVAAYYQYIDHELVEQRIVDVSGRWDTAANLRQLLNEVQGRTFGLPQGPPPSEVLAELVLAPIERRLQRAGHLVVRFSDDFRFGVGSRSAGSAAVEALAAELSQLGLTLNEEKCKVLHRDTYERNLGEIRRQIDDALAEIHLRPRVMDIYGTRSSSIPAPKRRNLQAISKFEDALTSVAEYTRGTSPTSRTVALRLAAIALPRLGNWKVSSPLELLPSLCVRQPGLSRAVGRYLRNFVRESGESAQPREALEATIKRVGPHAPAWQQIWLLEPLLDPAFEVSRRIESWLRKLETSAKPDILRARVLQALAVHGLVSSDEIANLFDRMSSNSRPDLTAAAAIAQHQASESTSLVPLTSESKIYEWVQEKVDESTDWSWL